MLMTAVRGVKAERDENTNMIHLPARTIDLSLSNIGDQLGRKLTKDLMHINITFDNIKLMETDSEKKGVIQTEKG